MPDVEKQLKLLSDVSAVIEGFRKEKRLADKSFTVFTALKNETKEVGTHTTFLYEILRPDGEHGMGSTFLKSFIREVMHIEVHSDSRLDLKRQYCIPKKRNGVSGLIDLVVCVDNMIYPIEVKIFAPDQPKQVERYFEFAKEQNSKCKNALPDRVYYLTLDGHRPESMGNL
ncbi:MAG: PD-(D/E)XK nuclease family protein [Succinivibrionaceae bacterium]|nr:PD-(D/E)XK nuclease family protein [Succinivibrionaceae bacterium]